MRIRYVCVSQISRRETEIESPRGDSIEVDPSPMCACGTNIKMIYTTPALRRLSKVEASQYLDSILETIVSRREKSV
jgi:hypothetical protein